MWFRAQLLPIIISEKIPVDDEHWQNFLNLILDSVFASVTSLDSAAFLLPTMSRFAGPARAGGKGTAGTAMAVPVLREKKWRRLDSNLRVRYRVASPSSSP